jgi:DAN domain.
MQITTFCMVALATLMSFASGTPLGDISHEKCLKVSTNERLHEPNCRPVEYSVDICSGKCNSWYIPVYAQPPIQICSACSASGSVLKDIELECVENGVAVKKMKTVIVGFTECKCQIVNCKRR